MDADTTTALSDPPSPSTTTTPRPRPLRPLQSRSPKTQYLIVYNFVSALLWLVILGRVCGLVPLVGFGSVYRGVGEFARATQTLALLEVVHAATGLVRAPILTTALQVASRILLVWGIVTPFPGLAKSAAYSSMLLAWSVSEVIRYSFFTLSLSGLLPRWLAWARYNAFFVLYPVGIASECWLVYQAVRLARGRRQEWAWGLQLVLGVYVPGSYIMYTHMMAQRRKVMRGKYAKREE